MPTAERREYMRQYGKKYREAGKLKEHKQSSVHAWLVDRMNGIRSSKGKRQLEVEIEVEYLEDLWEAQNGRCAITGVRMTTRFGSLFAASPDRIDSSRGYVKGNVQLVSKAANLAKGAASDVELREWINAIRTSG